MRYEDWTYREAEVRLAEHSELRRALHLRSVPDYTTLYRFLRRLDAAAITQALHEVVQRMALPRAHRRAPVAVDATGLAQGAASTFFVRRIYHHTQQPLPWRHWLKWRAVVDLKRQLILRSRPGRLLGMTVPICPRWSPKRMPTLRSAASWPPLSLIPSVTTPLFVDSFVLGASSPPSGAKIPGTFMVFAPKCERIFHERNTVAAR